MEVIPFAKYIIFGDAEIRKVKKKLNTDVTGVLMIIYNEILSELC